MKLVIRPLILILVLGAGSLALWPSDPVEAQGVSCSGYNEQVLSPVAGFQTITVGVAAGGLTVPQRARLAVITVVTDNVRYRDDGTDPTATVGHLVTAGSTIVVCGGPSLGAFRMIRQTGDATATVSYYGVR